ncbi:transposase InsO family protein [Defluviitalea raffinosedens]|nr:transposase InsO family protein [Defluviitalea raffinosedens]
MCFIDLFNKEIIGYRAGPNKTALLVKQTFQTVIDNLKDIQIFHTRYGTEFKKQVIEKTLKSFDIT